MAEIRLSSAPPRAASHSGRFDRISFSVVMFMLFGFAVILLVMPSLIVVVVSFSAESTLRFPPSAFSLRWYAALWQDSPEILAAFANSITVAIVATAVALLLGVSAAFASARAGGAWSRVLDPLFMLPLSLPTLALGLGLLIIFSGAGLESSLATLAVGHVILVVPYVFRTTTASLMRLDPNVIDAARTLGASAPYRFITIILPLTLGGILAGAFIGAMNSFDNVSVSMFLAGIGTEMLPLRLWNIIENLLDVRAAAVSGILILLSGVAALVFHLTGRLEDMARHG